MECEYSPFPSKFYLTAFLCSFQQHQAVILCVLVEFSAGSYCFTKIPSTALFRNKTLAKWGQPHVWAAPHSWSIIFNRLVKSWKISDIWMYGFICFLNTCRYMLEYFCSGLQHFGSADFPDKKVLLIQGLFEPLQIPRIIHLGLCQCDSVCTSAQQAPFCGSSGTLKR